MNDLFKNETITGILNKSSSGWFIGYIDKNKEPQKYILKEGQEFTATHRDTADHHCVINHTGELLSIPKIDISNLNDIRATVTIKQMLPILKEKKEKTNLNNNQ